MIVLIHGTGDDDTKPEQWMQWVAMVLKKYNENVLVLPGVASSQYSQIESIALDFLKSIPAGPAKNVLPGIMQADRNLRVALDMAGKELMAATKVMHAQEEAAITKMCADRARQGKHFASAQGIKLRAAVAGLCTMAYYRRTATPKPVRIIGHSRGGSAAMALHNLLTAMGISCDKTLLLDPVHGKRKALHKAYYRKVYSGSVTNIPARIKSNSFCNVPIIEATSIAQVTVENELMKIKHGHMGKFKSMGKHNKQDERARFANNLMKYLTNVQTSNGLRQNLALLFNRFLGPRTKDQCVIRHHVLETLA